VLYPAFQFHGSRTIPGLHDLLIEFDRAVLSPWTIASWFQSDQDELNGLPPVTYLNQYGFDERVRTAAERVVSRLAS
jgi:hypothetical protein